MTGEEQRSALVVSHDTALRSTVLDNLGMVGLAPLHEAASAGEVVLGSQTWGAGELALVDLGLPDRLGLWLIGELVRGGWERVVVLVDPDGADGAVAAMAAGAHGLLVTGADRVRDVVAVAAPGTWLAAGADAAGHEDLPNLSDREREILALVAGGESNKQIGERTGISPLTVKAHLARIGHKLATGDRAQLVAIALRGGFIG